MFESPISSLPLGGSLKAPSKGLKQPLQPKASKQFQPAGTKSSVAPRAVLGNLTNVEANLNPKNQQKLSQTPHKGSAAVGKISIKNVEATSSQIQPSKMGVPKDVKSGNVSKSKTSTKAHAKAPSSMKKKSIEVEYCHPAPDVVDEIFVDDEDLPNDFNFKCFLPSPWKTPKPILQDPDFEVGPVPFEDYDIQVMHEEQDLERLDSFFGVGSSVGGERGSNDLYSKLTEDGYLDVSDLGIELDCFDI
jgi:hypothetical protein